MMDGNEVTKQKQAPKSKRRRGFAAMDPEKQRALAAMGGRAVPNEKRSFSTDKNLAAKAGHKGGSRVPAAKRSFAINPELARTASRKGQEARGRRRKEGQQGGAR